MIIHICTYYVRDFSFNKACIPVLVNALCPVAEHQYLLGALYVTWIFWILPCLNCRSFIVHIEGFELGLQRFSEKEMNTNLVLIRSFAINICEPCVPWEIYRRIGIIWIHRPFRELLNPSQKEHNSTAMLTLFVWSWKGIWSSDSAITQTNSHPQQQICT